MNDRSGRTKSRCVQACALALLAGTLAGCPRQPYLTAAEESALAGRGAARQHVADDPPRVPLLDRTMIGLALLAELFTVSPSAGATGPP